MVGPYINITYGELLRLFRNKKRYTMKYVASVLGVTNDTIKNYECNRTIPSYYNILRLEKLYGEEFERLSVYLREEKKKPIKKNDEPMRLILESPHYIFHGSLEKISRMVRTYKYKFR